MIITEAEYILAALACSQVIWMKNCCLDFDVSLHDCVILYDYTSAINLAKNSITHSRSKHIDVKHHFIRDKVLAKEVSLNYVKRDDQIVDIFTKPLANDRFIQIRRKIGIFGMDDL